MVEQQELSIAGNLGTNTKFANLNLSLSLTNLPTYRRHVA